MAKKPKAQEIPGEDQVALSIKRIVDYSAHPEPAHRFIFAAVGDDVQLEVGHFDLPVYREFFNRAVEGKLKDDEAIEFFVGGRYVLTPVAAMNLLDTARKIVEHFRKGGRLPAEDEHPNDST